ncbi:sperm-associated antigen 16 protein-like [Erpetoichthys calabaricus]|uniref:sperm-associated antigen 16 protein-like n=1 Tax=Erpetoichthys calabaricus TaxID=27687 RepID=UPI0022340360|nr:sperm-associated antigen 16 protein-like [Erpetoichthys calabaricus]
METADNSQESSNESDEFNEMLSEEACSRPESPSSRPALLVSSQEPKALDDFTLNFLIKMGMRKTFDCFQTEWYEMMQRGSITGKHVGFVPEIYLHNQLLDNEMRRLNKVIECYKESAVKQEEILVKLQRERDIHRLHHRRVVQEKNRLISDMKRLEKHYACCEPEPKQRVRALNA